MTDIYQERYLGDGLFASFDGFQFCLRAPRYSGDHLVYLEPIILSAFEAYVKEVRATSIKARAP